MGQLRNQSNPECGKFHRINQWHWKKGGSTAEAVKRLESYNHQNQCADLAWMLIWTKQLHKDIWEITLRFEYGLSSQVSTVSLARHHYCMMVSCQNVFINDMHVWELLYSIQGKGSQGKWMKQTHHLLINVGVG